MRKSMQKGQFTGGNVTKKHNAFVRSARAIRSFFFNKTSAALLLGMGVGALCTASGLAGILGGSVCAVSAMGASSFLRHFFAVTPFGTHPSVPVSLGVFLASEFERNLDITSAMLGLPLIKSTGTASVEQTMPAM